MEMRGIEPRASRMQSERSTISSSINKIERGEEGDRRKMGETGEEEEVVRIFVGGLDVGVTASDVQKRFSLSPSLGKVLGVELITKNNNNIPIVGDGGGGGGGIPIPNASNFAYIDFQPSSPKSLLKLFSTYNGCVWKGGRLRLEKAKEHYMARLKREWEEEARLANDSGKGDADRGENMQASLKQLGRPAPAEKEKMHLQIFFPELRKVKSLPYRGTGKHKYSFQRVEVPSLPIHFCDCDEHCAPLETASGEQLSMSRTHFDGINAKELDIMNSVMNKLFEREAIVDSADTVITSADAGNYSRCTVDDVPSNEMVAAEEDNLLTNIVMERANGRADSMQVDGVETPMDKVLKDFKIQPSKGRPLEKQTNTLKRKKTAPANAPEDKLKKKARPADESVRDESSVKFEKRSSEVNSRQIESSPEAQVFEAQMKSDANLSARGVAWVQKSSWKELVGEAANSSFSIANVVPGSTSKKQTLPKSDHLAATNTINSRGPKPKKHATAQFNVDSSKLSAGMNHGALKDKLISAHDPNVETSENGGKSQLGLMGEKSSTVKDNILRLPEEPKKKVDVDGRARLAATGIGEVCTFMRSADSEREWTKARAALSGILKKKSKENNSKNS
ncbi:hypothetical protein ACLOJK_030908 [Asimina triloba]